MSETSAPTAAEVAGAYRVARPGPPDREAFLAWLKAYAGGGESWRANVLMGEHDIALAMWLDMLREEKRLRAALRGLLQSEIGRQTLQKLADGQGVNTEDGRAWLAAAARLDG